MSVLAQDQTLREAVDDAVAWATADLSPQDRERLITDALDAIESTGTTVREFTHRVEVDGGAPEYGAPVADRAVVEATIEAYGTGSAEVWSVVTRTTSTTSWTPTGLTAAPEAFQAALNETLSGHRVCQTFRTRGGTWFATVVVPGGARALVRWDGDGVPTRDRTAGRTLKMLRKRQPDLADVTMGAARWLTHCD